MKVLNLKWTILVLVLALIVAAPIAAAATADPAPTLTLEKVNGIYQIRASEGSPKPTEVTNISFGNNVTIYNRIWLSWATTPNGDKIARITLPPSAPNLERVSLGTWRPEEKGVETLTSVQDFAFSHQRNAWVKLSQRLYTPLQLQ